MIKTFAALFSLLLTVCLIIGCAGQPKDLQMVDTTGGGTRTITFPNGTIIGGASKGQASKLAQIFVDSHNMGMEELESLKTSNQKIKDSTQRIEESNKKTLETTNKNFETAQKALGIIEQLSKKQGTGEITIFFPIRECTIEDKSFEYERLVNFTDYLARESAGRKVLLVSIGSASATGDSKLNQFLSKKRSEFPIDIVDKYLINVSHEFYKIFSIGDTYSPKNATMDEHQRYQHVRVIAFYETDDLTQLPEEIK
ncbi:MAG: hypothetical protein HZA77_00120 [Candidatus Schekmanbacteria bacterium]|nr:hypothetical protein [Candidatus Schekmanbacteria bacterium]